MCCVGSVCQLSLVSRVGGKSHLAVCLLRLLFRKRWRGAKGQAASAGMSSGMMGALDRCSQQVYQRQLWCYVGGYYECARMIARQPVMLLVQ